MWPGTHHRVCAPASPLLWPQTFGSRYQPQSQSQVCSRRTALRGYGAAKDFLSCLRGVYRVAIEDGLVATDPTVGIRAPRPKAEGWHSWTPEECAAYERRWPVGTKQRTAYAIGIYTAQRISDAVALGRQHIRQGRLEFTQQKNRSRSPIRVVIPLAPPLAEALAGWQGSGLTFLETAYGRPFSADGCGFRSEGAHHSGE